MKKKVLSIIFIILLILIITFFCLHNNRSRQPITYYKVYLDGEFIGKISSKSELEKYINDEQQILKEKFNIENVYLPTGLEIKKELSYDTSTNDIKEIYDIIMSKSDLTIRGYQITIKHEDGLEKLYVLDENIFKTATETVIKTYVGTEKYEAYLNNTQDEIKDTGTIIQNVYIDNDITIKETNIPVNEKIYTDATELSKYLLFGTSSKQKIHTVEIGDTIEQVAYDNEISIEEFLISNPKYKKSTNMLAYGDQVIIAETDSKINVTVEQRSTDDYDEAYKTVEKIDPSVLIGYETVTQGQNGVLRITQAEKVVNGTITFIQHISKEELKPSVDKIVVRGSKQVTYIGNLTNWSWPTESGWKITSRFAYRTNPFGSGSREFHGAIDIAGPGYGSKIYAANNGTIVTLNRDSINGIYIVINHNNGYYTQYNHLSRYANIQVGQVVESGQLIGYMGSTGAATGPHLHLAVWKGGRPFSAGAIRINPCSIYKC